MNTIFTLLFLFKPLHVVNTPERSCGAASRLMKETVKVEVGDPRELRINGMPWEHLPQDDDGDFVAQYRVNDEAYMHMDLVYNTGGAYLSIEGIDYKRRPCKDMIYLKRIR